MPAAGKKVDLPPLSTIFLDLRDGQLHGIGKSFLQCASLFEGIAKLAGSGDIDQMVARP